MQPFPVPKMSPLCGDVTSDGKTVRVEIYQADSGRWILEVEDQHGNSTVWDDHFSSDAEALEEAQNTVLEDGIDSLIGPPSGKGEWS